MQFVFALHTTKDGISLLNGTQPIAGMVDFVGGNQIHQWTIFWFRNHAINHSLNHYTVKRAEVLSHSYDVV